MASKINITPVPSPAIHVKSAQPANIHLGNAGSINIGSLATEANATANKAEIIQAINNQGGQPAVQKSGNTLLFRLFTLKQMENVIITLSSTTNAKLEVITDDNDFLLKFTNDSPVGLSGETIYEDALYMYTDDVLMDITIVIPDTFEIRGVYIEGADCNLITDTEWRSADIRRALGNINIDTSALAKEATLGSSADSSISTTVFGWLKSIRDLLVGVVTTNPYAKARSLNWLLEFFGVTNATTFVAATKFEIANELVDIWHDVTGEYPPQVPMTGMSISTYVNGRYQYSDPEGDVIG